MQAFSPAFLFFFFCSFYPLIFFPSLTNQNVNFHAHTRRYQVSWYNLGGNRCVYFRNYAIEEGVILFFINNEFKTWNRIHYLWDFGFEKINISIIIVLSEEIHSGYVKSKINLYCNAIIRVYSNIKMKVYGFKINFYFIILLYPLFVIEYFSLIRNFPFFGNIKVFFFSILDMSFLYL